MEATWKRCQTGEGPECLPAAWGRSDAGRSLTFGPFLWARAFLLGMSAGPELRPAPLSGLLAAGMLLVPMPAPELGVRSSC